MVRVYGSDSQAARVCAAILDHLKQPLAGEERAIVVRDADARNARPRGQDAQRGGVEVWITPGEVEGCRTDVAAALLGAHAALVAVAGLVWSRRQGRGVVGEVAATDVIATCQGDSLTRLTCPRADQLTGADAADRVHRPPEVLRCADGYVGVHVPTDEDRRLLLALTAGEDLVGWVARRSRAEVVDGGQLWRLPVVPVLEPPEVASGEPFHFAWRSGPRPGPLKSLGRWPLSGVRVLDLGMVWAGPYCGRLLAGLGARVIKVEGPQRPDGTRRADHACQGAFADLNRGKASLVVDLSRADGRDVLLRLVRTADVLIENFSPRVMPNFGLDVDVVWAANPKLVMLSMPAFADGDGVAYGSGLEMAAGLAGWDARGRPLPSDTAYLDYLAGCYGAIGVLAAWLRAEESGGGGHVQVAQREVAAEALALGGARRQPTPGMAVDVGRLADRARRSGLLPRGGPAPSGCRHYARLPFRFAGLPRRRESDAPRFGAHTRQVLRREVGLTTAEIEALLASGVVQ